MNFALGFSFINLNLMSIISIMLIVFLAILLYRYFKGSVAFYILFGLLFVYAVSFTLNKIGFYFLANIIKQITNYGLIFIAIIFQPELRSILLTIGNNRIAKQIRKLKNKAFDSELTEKNKLIIAQIVESLYYLQENNLGGTIVVFEGGDISTILNTGIKIDGKVSSKLIESIFVKESPLHDGALVIQDGLIKGVSCILPVSEKMDLNSRVGLRHKSAVGVTEMSNCLAIVVSETTTKISYAREGRLYLDRSIEIIGQQLTTILNL